MLLKSFLHSGHRAQVPSSIHEMGTGTLEPGMCHTPPPPPELAPGSLSGSAAPSTSNSRHSRKQVVVLSGPGSSSPRQPLQELFLTDVHRGRVF